MKYSKVILFALVNCFIFTLTNAIQVMVVLKIHKLNTAGLIEVEPESTILNLKHKAAEKFIDVESSEFDADDWKNLVATNLSKEILQDGKTLKDYELKDGSAVFLN